MKLNSLLAISLISLLWCTPILANPSVELNKAALDEIKSSLQMDATTRALINAVSNNDVKSLVLNRELVNKNNEVFNVTTDVEGITNQKSTGRCWMFAGLNIMRPTARQKFNLKSFEFSQSYLFFWDKLEKSNMLLEAIIETHDRPVMGFNNGFQQHIRFFQFVPEKQIGLRKFKRFQIKFLPGSWPHNVKSGKHPAPSGAFLIGNSFHVGGHVEYFIIFIYQFAVKDQTLYIIVTHGIDQRPGGGIHL